MIFEFGIQDATSKNFPDFGTAYSGRNSGCSRCLSFLRKANVPCKSFSKFEQPDTLHTAYQIFFKEATKRNLNDMKNETARKPAKILQFQVDFYERGRVVRSFSTVNTFKGLNHF